MGSVARRPIDVGSKVVLPYMYGANYKTRMGMLVEIREVGASDVFHALADCTDADDKDMKAIILEERFKNAKTPEELYHLVPTVEPTVGGPERFLEGATLPLCGIWRLQATEHRDLQKSNAVELEGCRAFLPG